MIGLIAGGVAWALSRNTLKAYRKWRQYKAGTYRKGIFLTPEGLLYNDHNVTTWISRDAPLELHREQISGGSDRAYHSWFVAEDYCQETVQLWANVRIIQRWREVVSKGEMQWLGPKHWHMIFKAPNKTESD